MIERQVQPRPSLDPFRRRRIVAGLRRRPRHAGQECDRARVPARVALRIGVDAYELEPARVDAGLLHQLAPACVLDRLADVDEPARQRVPALEGRVPAPDQQQTTLGVEHDAIGGEGGCLWEWHSTSRGVSDPLGLTPWHHRIKVGDLAMRYRQRRAMVSDPEGLTPTPTDDQIPSAAFTCSSPSWCGVNLRPPSMPPSTTISVALTKVERSDANHSTHWAMSSGMPARGIGCALA